MYYIICMYVLDYMIDVLYKGMKSWVNVLQHKLKANAISFKVN